MDALKSLHAYLPADTGLAFMAVQHLDPKHESNLSEILANKFNSVQPAADGLEIERNHLYVIPPDTGLEIANQTLRVIPRSATSFGLHMPINHCFRSLAQDCGSRSIGVILSGAGTHRGRPRRGESRRRRDICSRPGDRKIRQHATGGHCEGMRRLRVVA